MQLLTVVQTNPNLPQNYKDSAIAIANYSIEVAQKAIVEQNINIAILPSSPPTISVPAYVPSSPQFGSVKEIKKELTIKDNNCLINKNGTYCNIGVVYTENGQRIAGVPITITADDAGTFIGWNSNGDMREDINMELSRTITDISASFQYFPQATGTRTLTIIANGAQITTETQGAFLVQ